ncbi:hypothetical protein BDZ89DRAFT_487042 [Hymenopellis radicata]|nr:hypothetical protein BDZ89DRAFT_487042 [Hymenopellis radicata]
MTSTLDVAQYIDDYLCNPECHWDAEDFDILSTPLSATVGRIHFCAANNDRNEPLEEGAQPVNHWMIFLQTGNTTSVRLSIRSGETSYPALIDLGSKTYIVSHFAPVVVSSNVTQGITVERIFRMLIENRRDRYIFTDQHVGCRYWCYCVADDLERQGWVDRGFAHRVYQKASWYYPDLKNTRDRSKPLVSSPIVAGTFF